MAGCPDLSSATKGRFETPFNQRECAQKERPAQGHPDRTKTRRQISGDVQYDLEKRSYSPVILGALHCARVAGCFLVPDVAQLGQRIRIRDFGISSASRKAPIS
jgi:hypothetical protein